MLRFVIIAVVVMAILVALRIVRLSFKFNAAKRVIHSAQPGGQVIEMPVRDAGPIVIKEFSFANFDESSAPKDEADFFERIFVKIGRMGGNDGQMYSLHVTTPKGLERALQSDSYRFGRDLLVVDRFDRTLVRAALEKHLYELPQLARQID